MSASAPGTACSEPDGKPGRPRADDEVVVTDADQQAESSRIAITLLKGWNDFTDTPLVGTRRREISQQQLTVAHGLAAHVHYLAEPALNLLDKGLVLAALPLVRGCFEAAITAQWVVQTDDGVQAFINEDVRQRRNHVKVLERAVSQVFRDAAPAIKGQLINDLDTQATARAFENLCNDLGLVGADGYATFRVLSQFSHASVVVVDCYLEPNDSALGLALRVDPNEPNAACWTSILVASLVWAGRAVDYMDKEHVRRSELRDAARQLGIRSDLQLSASAVKRQAEGHRKT